MALLANDQRCMARPRNPKILHSDEPTQEVRQSKKIKRAPQLWDDLVEHWTLARRITRARSAERNPTFTATCDGRDLSHWPRPLRKNPVCHPDMSIVVITQVNQSQEYVLLNSQGLIDFAISFFPSRTFEFRDSSRSICQGSSHSPPSNSRH